MGSRWLFLPIIILVGCASVDPGSSIDTIHADISDRVALAVNWEADRQGVDAVSNYVSVALGRELTVDDAVGISLLKNPALRAMYRELGVAQSDLVAAGLPQNPGFSSERRFKGKSVEFDVAQEFISLFLIPLRRRIAQSEFESQRLRLTHELVEHTSEVRKAYYEAQAAAQEADLRRTVVAATDASLEAARALRRAGNAAQLTVAEEERTANQAKLDLAEAELAVAEKRERMNVLLGLWGEETAWRILPRLPEPPQADVAAGELEKRAVSERLDLASLRAEVEAHAQTLGMTNVTSLLPEFTIGVHSEREPEGATSKGPSVSFPLPIFNRGEAARARANYALLEAGDRYAALAIQIRSDVRVAHAKMSVSKKRVGFYRQAFLPVQQRITNETQLRYNGMFVGVFELLRARQAQIDAASDYIHALTDYWLARTDLEKALGRRLPEGPLHPNSVEGTPEEGEMMSHAHHK